MGEGSRLQTRSEADTMGRGAMGDGKFGGDLVSDEPKGVVQEVGHGETQSPLFLALAGAPGDLSDSLRL